MTIQPFIAERLAEVSIIVLHIFFLYRTLDTKVGSHKQLIAAAVLVFIRTAYYAVGFGYRPLFSVLAGIMYASFVFAGQLRAYLIWTIIPVVLDGIVETAIVGAYLLLPNTAASQVDSYGFARIMLLIVARLALFAIYYWITRKIYKGHLISWQDCFPSLIVPVGCWALLEILFAFSNSAAGRMSSSLLTAGSVVLLSVMSNGIALYNRITADGKELTPSRLQLRTAELTQDHINQINDVYSKLSTVRHDLQGHFAAISGYIAKQDLNAIRDYMENIAYIDTEALEYAKHPVVNALIGSKAATAENSKIDFTVQIEMPDNLPISDVDLCILLSNILDNAFEANERLAEPRFVNLCTRVVNSYWVVACRNSTCEQRWIKTTDSLKSTKDSAGAHGIGTKQIQSIAEKSGGFVSYRHEGFEFTTLAMIKLSV
jgi:hypothetical protein